MQKKQKRNDNMSKGGDQYNSCSAMAKMRMMRSKSKKKKISNSPFPTRPFSTCLIMSANLHLLKHLQKQKRAKSKKKKKKVVDIINQMREMEELMSNMKSELESEKQLLHEGEATVEELQALIAQKREENNQHLTQIFWGQLLAHHLQFNVLPFA